MQGAAADGRRIAKNAKPTAPPILIVVSVVGFALFATGPQAVV